VPRQWFDDDPRALRGKWPIAKYTFWSEVAAALRYLTASVSNATLGARFFLASGIQAGELPPASARLITVVLTS